MGKDLNTSVPVSVNLTKVSLGRGTSLKRCLLRAPVGETVGHSLDY